jgi:hypothetical protein
MNSGSLLRIARGFSLTVGVLDFVTGFALLLAPAFTLEKMGAAPPSGDALEFVRFVGVFVGAVGAAYLWAIAMSDPARLRVTLILTTFFRTGAGLYTGIAVAVGTFDSAWLTVTATDVACVLIQVWLLVKGVGRNA